MRRLNRPVLAPEYQQAISKFRAAYPPDAQTRTENRRWKLFKRQQRKVYKAIISILENNQQGLCAFCETRLDKTSRQIEHFVPKYLTTQMEEWTINFENYTLTCLGNENPRHEDYSAIPSHKANLTCGLKKADLDPRGQICNPYDLPDEPIFHYEYHDEGLKYEPNEDVCRRHGIDPELVKNTIDHLGLNSPNLMRRRKKVWDDLIKEEDKIYKQNNDSPHSEELINFKNDELSPDKNGLPSFITLRRLFFAQYN